MQLTAEALMHGYLIAGLFFFTSLHAVARSIFCVCFVSDTPLGNCSKIWYLQFLTSFSREMFADMIPTFFSSCTGSMWS